MKAEYFPIDELSRKEHRIAEVGNIRPELFDKYVGVVGGYRGNYIVKYSDNETWFTEAHFPCPLTDIAKHLTGSGGFAVGLRSAWYSKYFDIDIDRSEWENEIRGDVVEYFSEHTDVFECERRGGGTSVIGRCKPVGTDILYECLQRIIEGELGWQVKDGIVEIFPRCDKGRRLPFGSDQRVNGILLKGVNGMLSKNEQLEKFIAASPVDLKQLSKGIEYDKTISDNNSGAINQFTGQTKQLLEVGLTEVSTRYEAEQFLIRHYYHKGYSEDEAFSEIESWLHSKNNGYSKEWNKDSQGLLRRVNGHVRSYYGWLQERQIGLGIDSSAKLSLGDVRYIYELSKDDIRYGEWLFDLFLYVKQRRTYRENLCLPAEIMKGFKNGGHAYTAHKEKLISSGFMSLKKDYEKDELARIYTVHYEFNDGKLSSQNDYRKALTNVFSQREIKKMFKKTTAYELIKK